MAGVSSEQRRDYIAYIEFLVKWQVGDRCETHSVITEHSVLWWDVGPHTIPTSSYFTVKHSSRNRIYSSVTKEM